MGISLEDFTSALKNSLNDHNVPEKTLDTLPKVAVAASVGMAVSEVNKALGIEKAADKLVIPGKSADLTRTV